MDELLRETVRALAKLSALRQNQRPLVESEQVARAATASTASTSSTSHLLDLLHLHLRLLRLHLSHPRSPLTPAPLRRCSSTSSSS